MNDRIESALAELPEATPGPWNQIRPRGSNGFYYVDHEKPYLGFIATVYSNESDAILIAAAPDLAAEVIRLRAEVARIKTIIADCDGPDETNKADPSSRQPVQTHASLDAPCITPPIAPHNHEMHRAGESAPTPTSKNIADQLFRLIDDDFDVISWNWEKALSIIDSALTQAAADARREAAEEFCRQCSERDEVDDGTLVCEFDWKGDACKKRAAILGHGEGKP